MLNPNLFTMKQLNLVFAFILIVQIPATYGIYYKIEDYTSWDRMVSLDIRGDFVYTVNYYAFFEIIDVSDPGHPTQVSSLNLIDHVPGVQGRVVVSDTLAFVLGQNYIHVVDVSDPENPVCISVWDYSWSADIEISGNLAYIASHFEFRILDISNVQSPQSLGYIPGEMNGICKKDNSIFGVKAGSPVRLRVIDVEDPQNPILITNFELTGNNAGVGGDIEISGSNTYIVNGKNFWSVDISDPYIPVIIDNILASKIIYKIGIDGNKALFTQSYSGIKVIDITNPYELSELGYYDTPGVAEQVMVSGNIAYIANSYSGLQIVDISDHTNPFYLSSLQTNKEAKGFDTYNNLLYLADGQNEVNIVDISNVLDPTILSTFSFGYGPPVGISIYNNRLCLSNTYSWSELFFIDISNPGNPVVNYAIDYSYLLYQSIAVYQTDNHIFAGAYDTLSIYDVSDFNYPTLISKYQTQSIITDIQVSGNYAFASMGEDGIEVIDIEYMTVPQYSNSFDTPGEVVKILVHENALIISDRDEGVQIYEISDPTDPLLIASLKPNSNTDFRIKPLIVNDKMIIVDREWNEIFTYDISDIDNIQLLNSEKVNFEIYELAYYNDLLVCSLNDNGLIFLNNSILVSDKKEEAAGNKFSNFDIFPNPVNHQAILRLNLSSPISIKISIYNTAGSCIKSWQFNDERSGQNEFVLNLANMSTGIYLCSVKVGNETMTKKMIKIKL